MKKQLYLKENIRDRRKQSTAYRNNLLKSHGLSNNFNLF